jgi:hypothetical protein
MISALPPSTKAKNHVVRGKIAPNHRAGLRYPTNTVLAKYNKSLFIDGTMRCVRGVFHPAGPQVNGPPFGVVS